MFVLETVDVASSSMSCNRGAGGQTARVSIYFHKKIVKSIFLSLQVSIKTREGFVFKGVVRPPNEIVSMEGGDFFGDFVENVPLSSNPVKTSACGGYGVNIVGKIFPKVNSNDFLFQVFQTQF